MSPRKPQRRLARAEHVDLTGKRAIVTGVSPGSLGYETAKTLLRWGALVIVTQPRDTGDTIKILGAELADEGVDARVDGRDLDLMNRESVETFARWYQASQGERLDILVNNAGIHLDLMSDWKEPRLSADGHELMWRTNYLGTVHLTHCLLPTLRKTGGMFGEARVVNVASQLHSRGTNEELFATDAPYESWKAYGLSKLGLIHFSVELHRRFADSDNLRSYCLHPGGKSGVRTNVATVGLEGRRLIGLLRKLTGPIERLFQASPREGAQTQIFCATAKNAASGHYYVNCAVAEPSPEAREAATSTRLWQETMDWIARGAV